MNSCIKNHEFFEILDVGPARQGDPAVMDLTQCDIEWLGQMLLGGIVRHTHMATVTLNVYDLGTQTETEQTGMVGRLTNALPGLNSVRVDAVCFVYTCRRLIDLSLPLYIHAGA